MASECLVFGVCAIHIFSSIPAAEIIENMNCRIFYSRYVLIFSWKGQYLCKCLYEEQNYLQTCLYVTYILTPFRTSSPEKAQHIL